MTPIIITINTTSEGYYAFDIYQCEHDELEEQEDPIDGGICTSTIENALNMANDMVKDLLQNNIITCK